MLNKFKKGKEPCLCSEKSKPTHITPDEKPHRPFKTCGKCRYAGHGFLCGSREGDCLKTHMDKLNKRKA